MRCVVYPPQPQLVKPYTFNELKMSNKNLCGYLYVFNHIISKGIKEQGKFNFGELSAWHDFDGYTCYIGYKDLTMSIYFHSRHFYEYREDASLKAFKLLIDKTVTELKVS